MMAGSLCSWAVATIAARANVKKKKIICNQFSSIAEVNFAHWSDGTNVMSKCLDICDWIAEIALDILPSTVPSPTL